jgi:hypothetical protein
VRSNRTVSSIERENMTEPRVPNIFEREAIQQSCKLDETYMVINSSVLAGIKIRQSSLAPKDEIIIHPSILIKIINNVKDGEILIKKG